MRCKVILSLMSVGFQRGVENGHKSWNAMWMLRPLRTFDRTNESAFPVPCFFHPFPEYRSQLTRELQPFKHPRTTDSPPYIQDEPFQHDLEIC